MKYFIKKNKKTIFSSFIFIEISYLNTFGKCCENKCGNGKGDKNITNNNNNKTPGQTLDPDKDPNKKPEETPDPGKDPNGDKPEEDNLKKIKDILKKFLNSVIKDNNNLEEDARVEINITEVIIDSKKNKNDLILIENELNKINNQIIKKTAEINQEKAKEILRNDCLNLLKECRDLNRDVKLPMKINIDENQINSVDYETLETYKTNLKNLKSSIEIQKNKEIQDEINKKNNLIEELKKINEDLKKNVIQCFFEHKVLKTKYDDEINETKTIDELEEIKKELKYILKCPFNNETLGGFDYDIINYDEIMEDLKSINTYRIMNIFYKIVSYGSFYDKQEYRYIIFENKNSLIDPFTNVKATYYKKFFDFIHYILFEYDNFFEELKSLATKTDSNSYFANYLKLLFYTDDRKKHIILVIYVIICYHLYVILKIIKRKTLKKLIF